MEFRRPQVILFVADTDAAARFYEYFGFVESFRSQPDPPVKIELELDGFTLGLALPGPAAEWHSITPVTSGHRACIILWTDDVDAAYRTALAAGGRASKAPHPFLEGKLRVAFVEDLDGHPVQFAQAAASKERPGAGP